MEAKHTFQIFEKYFYFLPLHAIFIYMLFCVGPPNTIPEQYIGDCGCDIQTDRADS